MGRPYGYGTPLSRGTDKARRYALAESFGYVLYAYQPNRENPALSCGYLPKHKLRHADGAELGEFQPPKLLPGH